MGRVCRRARKHGALIEALEPRTLLSVMPLAGNGLKGWHLPVRQVSLNNLISKPVAGSYGGMAFIPTGVNASTSPETLATFYSTVGAAHIKVTIDWGDGT